MENVVASDAKKAPPPVPELENIIPRGEYTTDTPNFMIFHDPDGISTFLGIHVEYSGIGIESWKITGITPYLSIYI